MAGACRRALFAVAGVVVTAGVLVVGASAAGAAPVSAPDARAEQEFLDLVNQERAGAGLAPLALDRLVVPIAREWAAQMATTSKLSHRPDLRSQIEGRVTRQWSRIGENVGKGASVSSLHAAFMASTGHRDNVLGPYNRVGIGVVAFEGRTWVTFNFLQGAAISGATGTDLHAGDLWVAGESGHVWALGGAADHGSLAEGRRGAPIVGIVASPSKGGYWLVADDGQVFAFGDAGACGANGPLQLNRPIVGMAPTPTGRGCWLVASDGGIFAFGDARYLGSTGGRPLNKAVLGMAATPTGDGYWLTASDGGIFAFGDARFLGSTGATALNQPITGMAATPSGNGYWLVARDGGIFTFGDARFHGSGGRTPLNSPVTGIAATASGGGYRIVTRDGRVVSFGDAGSGSSGPLAGGSAVAGLAMP